MTLFCWTLVLEWSAPVPTNNMFTHILVLASFRFIEIFLEKVSIIALGPFLKIWPIKRLQFINRCDILLFDKADLYFTNEIFNKIKNLEAISIISIKNKNHLNMCGDIGIYRLINKGNNIKVVEWGCDD